MFFLGVISGRAAETDEYERILSVRDALIQFGGAVAESQGRNTQVQTDALRARASDIIKRFEAIAGDGDWQAAMQKAMLSPDGLKDYLVGLMCAYAAIGDDDKAFMVFQTGLKHMRNHAATVETARQALLRAKAPETIIAGYTWMKGRGWLISPTTYNRDLLVKVASAYDALHEPEKAGEARAEIKKVSDALAAQEAAKNTKTQEDNKNP